MRIELPFLRKELDVKQHPLTPRRETYELTEIGKEKADKNEAEGAELRILHSLATGAKSPMEVAHQTGIDPIRAEAILEDFTQLQWARKRGGGF